MNIEDRLQIILITFNRAKFAKETLEVILSEESPVKNCEIIIQDNNSTDNTREIAEEFVKNYSNVKYTKNRYNIGISGNIERAMDVASMEYVWILGDDDIFDFSNWREVEAAIEKGEKVICLSDYAIPEGCREKQSALLYQLTFITGGIYSTSIFTDTTMRNAVDNIYTLFPHSLPVVDFLNKGGKIYMVSKAIVDNGSWREIKDYSFLRGIKDSENLSERTREMSWILGYCNAVSLLKDKSLLIEAMDYSVDDPWVSGNRENFFNYLIYLQTNREVYFKEIYPYLSDKIKKELDSKISWRKRARIDGKDLDIGQVIYLLWHKLLKFVLMKK